MPLRARKIISAIGTSDRVNPKNFMTQLWLAKQSGYCIRQVQRWLDKFSDYNLIKRTWRYKTSCYYYVNPMLHTPEFRIRLQTWLYPLTLSLSLLASSWGIDPSCAKDYSKNVVLDLSFKKDYLQKVTTTLIDSRELRWLRLEKLKKRKNIRDSARHVSRSLQNEVRQYVENVSTKQKLDEVLRRSQARIKARNRGLRVGTSKYKDFIASHT